MSTPGCKSRSFVGRPSIREYSTAFRNPPRDKPSTPLSTFRSVILAFCVVGGVPAFAEEKQDLATAKEYIVQAHAADKARRPDEASVLYRKAVQTCQRLVEKAPGDLHAAIGLGDAHFAFGTFLDAERQYEQALAQYRGVLAITERIDRVPASGEQMARFLSMIHQRIGTMHLNLGQPPEALASFQKGLAAAERRLAHEPDNLEAQRQIATRYNSIAQAHRERFAHEDALVAYKTAEKIARTLVEKHPEDFDCLRELALAIGGIGNVHAAGGRNAEALANLDQSLSLTLKYVALRPKLQSPKMNLAIVHAAIGEQAKILKQTDKALTHFGLAVALYKELSALQPGDPSYRESLGDAIFKAGEIQHGGGMLTDALQSFQTARDTFQQLIDEGNETKNRRLFLIVVQQRLAAIYWSQKNREEVIRYFRSNRENALRLVAMAPDDGELVLTLADAEYQIAHCIMDGLGGDNKETATLVQSGLDRLHKLEKRGQPNLRHKQIEKDLLNIQKNLKSNR